MRFLVAAVAAALVGAAAADPVLERGLKSDNPAELRAAFERIERDAGRIDPVYVMLMSGKLQQAGRNDDALFWFLAGQLRMRYVLAVSPDETRGQAFGSITAGLGMAIYPAFQFQEEKIAAAVDRVLEWDRKTEFDLGWLKGREILPRAEWPQKFQGIREGMLKMKAEFLALPKDECERARHGMPDWRKEREKSQSQWNSETNQRRVASGFSTAQAAVTTDGIPFRIGKNYLSPFGSPDTLNYRQSISLVVFLPELSGYTRENWGGRFDPQRLGLGISSPKQSTLIENYAGQIPKAGKPLREINGLKVYASSNAHKCFPEWVLAGTLQDGAPVYGNCIAMDQPYAGCTAYFHGASKTYNLSLGLRLEHLPQWRELVTRVRSLVESWQHAAR